MDNIYDTVMNEYNAAHQGFWLKPPPPTHRIGRWPQIYWIGHGSKTSGIHTKGEFLKIVRNTYPDSVYWRRRGDREIPAGKIKKGDIAAWIAFVNATWI